MLQQQEHAAGREQAQVVCFMQQPDSLVGLVVILAAKNGIEGVLSQQGGQACYLFAVEQLGGGSPRSLSPG